MNEAIAGEGATTSKETKGKSADELALSAGMGMGASNGDTESENGRTAVTVTMELSSKSTPFDASETDTLAATMAA